jgi:hypothetical protein
MNIKKELEGQYLMVARSSSCADEINGEADAICGSKG